MREKRELQAIMDDIMHMKLEFEECVFTWVGREANIAAHELAFLSSQQLLQDNWWINIPRTLQSSLDLDCSRGGLNPNSQQFHRTTNEVEI